MSLFSFSKSEVKNAGLLLDVGSHSVGGAIYVEEPSGKSKILYSTREQIGFKKTLNGDLLLHSMIKSLDLVLIHIEKYGLKHANKSPTEKYRINKIDTILSSPWYISETKNLSVSHDKPFLITDTLIADLINKEEATFRNGTNVSKKVDSDLTLLEHKITDITLNGYPTINPNGKLAQKIEFKFYTCLSPKHVSEKINNSVYKHFSVDKNSFHSSPSVFLTEISQLYPELKDSVLVIVGGEVTDITTVSNGNIVENISVPLGHNNLLRSLSKVCDKHPDSSLEAVMELYKSKRLNKSEEEGVAHAIEDTRLSWSELFSGTVSDFINCNFSKKTIFVFEDTPYTSLFDDFVNKIVSSYFGSKEENIDVKNGDDVASVLTGSDNTISADIHIAIGVDYVIRHSHSIVR